MSLEQRLITAIRAGKTEEVAKLLKEGASPEVWVSAESTGVGTLSGMALTWAAWHGNVPILTLLLEAGAKATAKDSESLRYATQKGQREAAFLLLDQHSEKELQRLLEIEVPLNAPVPRSIVIGRLESLRRKRERAEVMKIRETGVELEP